MTGRLAEFPDNILSALVRSGLKAGDLFLTYGQMRGRPLF